MQRAPARCRRLCKGANAMIRSLRKRHLFTFIALAVVLPILFVLALGSRLAEPIMDEVPADLLVEGARNP